MISSRWLAWVCCASSLALAGCSDDVGSGSELGSESDTGDDSNGDGDGDTGDGDGEGDGDGDSGDGDGDGDGDTGDGDGDGCSYPPGVVVPMALGEVLSPDSWPTAIHRDGTTTPLDLFDAHCDSDSVIDWSPHDILVFISIPAW